MLYAYMDMRLLHDKTNMCPHFAILAPSSDKQNL